MARSGYPLYQQLKSWLLSQIESASWSTGQKIPTEHELIEVHGISRTTVRQAIQDLVASGHLIRQQGRGTFVAEQASTPRSSSVLYGFLEDLERQGRDIAITARRTDTLRCPPDIAVSLRLTKDEEVIRLSRTVAENGQVIYCDESYLPEALVRPHKISTERLAEHIYQTLEEHGIVIASGDQIISAEIADEATAVRLGCTLGEALLRIERITRDSTGRPIEYAIARYRAASYQYHVRLMRTPF